jgi:hypothetical protein
MAKRKEKTKGEKEKQWSSKQYIEDYGLCNTKSTTEQGWTQVLRMGKQFLLH